MGSSRHAHVPVAALCALTMMVGAACADGEQESNASARPATAQPERTTIDLGEGDIVSFLESLPADDAVAHPTLAGDEPVEVPVVFLHGAAYDATVWSETGLLEEVAATGHRAVAIDLPGKGESVGERGPDWLSDALDALDIGRVVIVSPSASGPVALELLSSNPDRFAGFVAVAPVGADQFDWPGGKAPATVVVLGEQDSGSSRSARDLAGEIPGATLAVIEDAGHAAHEDSPGQFMEAIRPLL